MCASSARCVRAHCGTAEPIHTEKKVLNPEKRFQHQLQCYEEPDRGSRSDLPRPRELHPRTDDVMQPNSQSRKGGVPLRKGWEVEKEEVGQARRAEAEVEAEAEEEKESWQRDQRGRSSWQEDTVSPVQQNTRSSWQRDTGKKGTRRETKVRVLYEEPVPADAGHCGSYQRDEEAIAIRGNTLHSRSKRCGCERGVTPPEGQLNSGKPTTRVRLNCSRTRPQDSANWDRPREQGAKVLKSKEELSGRLEEKETKKSYELQITEDLDEFVESVSEIPKMAQKEPAVKTEKTIRKKSPEAKADSKTKPASSRKKTELRGMGLEKEDVPWEGVTLNKCLIVASFVALLSMGFQILQDAVDVEDEDLETSTIVWAQPEISPVDNIAEKQPESWFFESWFESPEEEPKEVSTETEEIPEAPSANTVLKESQEKAKSTENRTEEDKQILVKLKPPLKLEKPKLQRAPKRDLHPQEEEVKSNKIRKPSKENIPKKEDKYFLKTYGEGKAKRSSREVKGQPFFKDRGEGKPHYPKNPEGKHVSDFKYEHSRFHKARKNSSHDYRAHKEQKDYKQQEQKGGKSLAHDRFFPQKEKKEEFYAKHKHD